MSGARITAFDDKAAEKHTITALSDEGGLKPASLHAGWTGFSSKCSVRAIAVAASSPQVWMATWGGIVSWDRREGGLYRRYGSEHGLAGNVANVLWAGTR